MRKGSLVGWVVCGVLWAVDSEDVMRRIARATGGTYVHVPAGGR